MKIKVLHIQETIGSGGVERRRLSLTKFLDKNLFHQIIICTCIKGNIGNEIKQQGVEIIEIGKLRSAFHWSQHKKVQKVIEDFQPDIIHGAVFEGVTMAAINGWLKNVPAIVIEETSDPQNRSWRGDLLMKIFSRLSNKVIGVSEGVTQDYLRKKIHIQENKVVLINNGVALPRLVSNDEITMVKTQLGIDTTDFVVGSAGRMLHDSHKRFSDLIKAFAQFSRNKSNVKLLLVGDGPELDGYIRLAKELAIVEKVIFTRYQSDITLYYKLMSIFCLVSAREAFGLVLAEAMLNNLPVVATRVGGMKYIVKDGKTGFLVEPFQTEEIAEKLEKLYQDPALGEKMGKSGYIRAMQEYTEEVYVSKVEKLYLELYHKTI